MGVWRTGGALRSLCLAILLLGNVSQAYALDAFWQGRRSAFWEHGIDPATGKSNWYSRVPRRGVARAVPDGGAVFAPNPVRATVAITEPGTSIGAMLFTRNGPQYAFNVLSRPFRIVGGGVFNNSARVPVFNIRSRGTLSFRNAAALSSSTAAKSARINVNKGGALHFSENSRGGNAVVVNDSSVFFHELSSAERMTITNRPTEAIDGPDVRFEGRSNGGMATFVNGRRGLIDFRLTRGPAGNRQVSSGKITNLGSLSIGSNRLTVNGSYFQTLDGIAGSLTLQVEGNRAGRLQVNGVARLGGKVFVEGTNVVPGYNHIILHAAGGRLGGLELETSIPGAFLFHHLDDIYLTIPR
jgi:hypothetical protein